MFKYLLFDFDGVIVNTVDAHYLGYKSAFDYYSIQYNKEDFLKYYGLETKMHVTIFLENSNYRYDTEIIDSICNLKKETYFHYILKNNIDLIPGIELFLRRLMKMNIKCGLATNTNKIYVNHLLDKYRLKKYFQKVVTKDDIIHPKPNPESYNLLVSLFDSNPSDCLGFEDTMIGIKALEAANIKSVLVSATKPKSFNDEKVISNFINVENILYA